MLVGHSGTTVTELVYRHQIRPVIQTGALVIDAGTRRAAREGSSLTAAENGRWKALGPPAIAGQGAELLVETVRRYSKQPHLWRTSNRSFTVRPQACTSRDGRDDRCLAAGVSSWRLLVRASAAVRFRDARTLWRHCGGLEILH